MPLDPNDPLIPMPWQMEDIRKYREAKQFEAARKQLQYEKDVMDMQEKMSKTPEGRITEAEELTKRAEEIRQKREGIQFGDVARDVAIGQNKSLLEASKAQGIYNIEQAALGARQAAIENILAGGKGLVPTEKYDYQGVSGVTLRGQGAGQLSNARRNVFQADYNDFFDMAKFQGADDQQAHQIAIQKSEQKALKSQDKISILLPGGGTFVSTPEKMNQMRDDPNTPKDVRDAIISQWGAGNKQTAQSWLSSRIPKAVK